LENALVSRVNRRHASTGTDWELDASMGAAIGMAGQYV
jgi:hypothetical protein